MSAVELVIDIKNAVGESPVWHAGEQALYWVDIPAKTLHFLKEGQALQTWQASEMIGCIAPHASGGWIAGMESGIFHLQPQTMAAFKKHAWHPFLIQERLCEPTMAAVIVKGVSCSAQCI